MRKVLAVLLVVLVAAAIHLWLPGARPDGPPAAPPAGARLTLTDGIAVLRLAGPPRAKGRAHGVAMADRIRSELERVRPSDPGLREVAIETSGDRLLPFLPDAMRAELEGLAEGAGITVAEALYLNTRFELASFHLAGGDLRPADLLGEAAVGPGPEVCRHFATERLVEGLTTTTLVVMVHEDRDPPLVLVGLPGMIGGFAGLRGEVAGALCPVPGQVSPVLNGLVWPLLLRHLLEQPPGPGGALSAKATLAASIPLRATGGRVGTLNVTPAGATWYAGRTFAATVEAGDSGEAGVERAGAILAMEERARRLLQDRDCDAGIRLAGARDGFSVAIGKRRARVRYGG
ncbi:MAG: C45 family peptidase [Planctomycetota bacterium]|jgi:hypothetical protein